MWISYKVVPLHPIFGCTVAGFYAWCSIFIWNLEKVYARCISHYACLGRLIDVWVFHSPISVALPLQRLFTNINKQNVIRQPHPQWILSVIQWVDMTLKLPLSVTQTRWRRWSSDNFETHDWACRLKSYTSLLSVVLASLITLEQQWIIRCIQRFAPQDHYGYIL